jgi:hypothetical protein
MVIPRSKTVMMAIGIGLLLLGMMFAANPGMLSVSGVTSVQFRNTSGALINGLNVRIGQGDGNSFTSGYESYVTDSGGEVTYNFKPSKTYTVYAFSTIQPGISQKWGVAGNGEVYVKRVTMVVGSTPPPGTISGYVVSLSTNIAVTGAEVAFTGPPGTSGQSPVITDGTGYFWKSLPSGLWSVVATDVAAGKSKAALIATTDATVAQVAIKIDYASGVMDYGTLSGTVTRSGTGVAIIGATIKVMGSTVYTARTGLGGRYSLSVSVDHYILEVYADGFGRATFAITVTPSGVTKDFVLDPVPDVWTTTIKGTVTSEKAGAAVVGAKVVADAQYTTYTDSSGKYEFSALPTGNHVITVTAEGFVGQSFSAQSTGGEMTVDFSLTPRSLPPPYVGPDIGDGGGTDDGGGNNDTKMPMSSIAIIVGTIIAGVFTLYAARRYFA